VAIRQTLLPPDDPDLAVSRSVLAGCGRFTGNLDEADRISREALEVLRAHGETDERLLAAIGTRAGILLAKNDFEAAELLYQDLLKRQSELLGPDHLDLCSTLNNLGFLLRMQGRLGEAEESYRAALEILDALVGEAHPHPVQVRLNLVSVLMLQGKASEAVALMRRIVEIRKEMHGPRHWRVGSALVNGLGDLLMDAGLYREAEPAVREGLEIYVDALGPDHRWSAQARGNLGACLLGLGRRAEADGLIQSSLSSFRSPEALSRDDWRTLHDIVKHLDALGETEVAAGFREILETRKAPPGA
jgi:tetratricopeptide (TPR) repeat protein